MCPLPSRTGDGGHTFYDKSEPRDWTPLLVTEPCGVFISGCAMKLLLRLLLLRITRPLTMCRPFTEDSHPVEDSPKYRRKPESGYQY